MPKLPPVHETRFIQISRNHRELTAHLTEIGIASPDVLEYAKQLCSCWFNLAEEHFKEANAALAATCGRAVFSRSYYAAYNASKAARYIAKGAISVKADDHAKASADLPSDLPNVAQWAQDITLLYEHRLRADYDNWSDTAASNTLTPADSIALAGAFIEEVRAYRARAGPIGRPAGRSPPPRRPRGSPATTGPPRKHRVAPDAPSRSDPPRANAKADRP